MKFTFLGTSHGVPGTDRFCTSIMLEAGESIYIFDGGAPVADLLYRKGINFDRIKAVFNTHPHGDHFLGMLLLVDLVNWYFGNAAMDVLVPRESQVKFIHDLSYVTENRPLTDRISVRKYTEGKVYEDDLITVTAEPTDHIRGDGDFLSYAFIIDEKATGKRVLFTGDCSAPLADIERITKDRSFDLTVFECAHFPYELLEERLVELDTEKVAVIHVWGLDKYPLIEASRDRYQFEILTPDDGDVVEV